MKKKQKRMAWCISLLLLVVMIAAFILVGALLRAAVQVERLEDGLYYMDYTGDYGLEAFLEQGGASSDLAVADFAVKRFFHGAVNLHLQPEGFGCSTLAASGPEGRAIFGRNFDWGSCTALVVKTRPKDGYASLSTVNMDFLDLGLGLSEEMTVRLLSIAAPYAPLDGMNEKGLCAAVLMIEDHPAFAQDNGRPDLTTTTAVRLLLDQAADVEEAIDLLEQYDLHASADMMVHFALSDASGRSVVVEYIDNEMQVVETPVVTNFYLAAGDKQYIGTAESLIRYEMLMNVSQTEDVMTMEQVREALESVSKHHFDSPFASTEWSIVYDQTNDKAYYYHREDYTHAFPFYIK